MAFAALSALVSTCDLVTSPEYDGAKACGRILKQKQRVYIEYLTRVKKNAKAMSSDVAQNYQVVMPSGFSTIIQVAPLTPKLINLIQKSSVLNDLFASQAMPQDHDVRHKLIQLAKEVNYHCSDILLCQNVDRFQNVLVLGLSCHCYYIAKEMTHRFSAPRMGLGISILLQKMACMSLARDYGLKSALHMGSPAVRDAIVWAGSMLLATSSEGDPA
ncbi:MAG: hypothetical protein Q9195_006593 [Heterodermia aff. obscurata]